MTYIDNYLELDNDNLVITKVPNQFRKQILVPPKSYKFKTSDKSLFTIDLSDCCIEFQIDIRSKTVTILNNSYFTDLKAILKIIADIILSCCTKKINGLFIEVGSMYSCRICPVECLSVNSEHEILKLSLHKIFANIGKIPYTVFSLFLSKFNIQMLLQQFSPSKII
jgi:hypothetical protein